MRSGLWQCSTSKAVQTMSEEKVLSGMRCAIYNRCSTTEEAQNRAIETQAEQQRKKERNMPVLWRMCSRSGLTAL